MLSFRSSQSESNSAHHPPSSLVVNLTPSLENVDGGMEKSTSSVKFFASLAPKCSLFPGRCPKHQQTELF